MLGSLWGCPSEQEDILNFLYSQRDASENCIENGDWSLNNDVFDNLNYYFGPFQVDVCASEVNAKCLKYCTKLNSCFNNAAILRNSQLYVNAPFDRFIQVFKFVMSLHDGKFTESTHVLPLSSTNPSFWNLFKGCYLVCLYPIGSNLFASPDRGRISQIKDGNLVLPRTVNRGATPFVTMTLFKPAAAFRPIRANLEFAILLTGNWDSDVQLIEKSIHVNLEELIVPSVDNTIRYGCKNLITLFESGHVAATEDYVEQKRPRNKQVRFREDQDVSDEEHDIETTKIEPPLLEAEIGEDLPEDLTPTDSIPFSDSASTILGCDTDNDFSESFLTA